MAALTKKVLNQYGFFNDHGFAYDRGILNTNYPYDRPVPKSRIYGEHRIPPMIVYVSAQRGRFYKPAYWSISQGSVVTDLNAHWRDNGRKVFDVYKREDKQSQLEAAMAWAFEKFGVAEWKKTPFGGYMPAEFVDARVKQLKDWIKTIDA